MVKTLQRKLAIKGATLNKAEKKLRKRSEFLDAWEVSLKTKEVEMVSERDEIERLKRLLRKVGEDLLALSERTEPDFESISIDEDIIEDMTLREEPEEKKSFLGLFKGKSKKSKKIFKSPPRRRPPPSKERQALREALEAKRERLRSQSAEELTLEDIEEPLEDELGVELGEEEAVYSCPACGTEISLNDEVCSGCNAELNWGT
ncbi:MAG: zinc ribbon domain-containing protein [Methanomassiliicoccales archaeon]|nr:MAG: zinc ribbon domain-containing protein [Methanomassiliicoccales archaeon]